MFNMFKSGPENIKPVEKKAENFEVLQTEVNLNIMRHSKKENDPSRPNSELLLTPEGRELAHEKGAGLNPDINVSVAGASPMDRTAETAMLVMGANEDQLGVNDSLEEMEKKIAEELKVGKKLYRDERLGFNLDGPIYDEGMAAFNAGRYAEWLLNESDALAIKKGDPVSTTYLRQAGNIAELVKRYEIVGDNFHRLALNKEKDGAEFTDHLERYLVTHQTVAECFVSEVIKEKLGAPAREEFISSLKNGWAETKGINIHIFNKGQEQSMIMNYQDAKGPQEIELSREIVDKIIRRRNAFEDAVKTSMNVADKLRA